MAAVALLCIPPYQLHASRKQLHKPNSQRSHLLSMSALHLKTTHAQHLQPLLPNSPTSSDYSSMLESCNCFHFCRQIHAHAIKNHYSNHHEFLGTKLLTVYGRCGGFDDACLLFDKMPLRNIYTWAAILTVCVDRGFPQKALLFFGETLFEGIELDFFVFPVVVKACSRLGALELGRGLHGFVVKCGFTANLYVSNALIDMYGKCFVPDEAMKVFNGMEERDCVSWNSAITNCAVNGMVFEALELLKSMQSLDELKPNLVSWSAAVAGLAQNGHDEEALELLHEMIESGVKPNAQTLACIFPACARLRALGTGKEIHGYVMRHGLMTNAFAVNGLIDVYRRCNKMEYALELFSRFSARNSVSYNTMIVGYCENNELGKANELFQNMELDGVKRDTISWSSLISGYCDNEKYEEALKMFRVMLVDDGIEPDSFTLGSILNGCASLLAPRQGKEVHAYAIRRGLHSNNFVGGALVEMYFKCEKLDAAEVVFFNIVDRNTVTWNILISGYARANRVNYIQELLYLMHEEGFDANIYTWNGIMAGLMENGHNELALKMFSEMQTTETSPDIFTIGMIITVCSRLISIEKGKQVHAYSIRCGYDKYIHIGAALVDMYAKCGSVQLAKLVFDRISQHNSISFNSMLAGYAVHGLGDDGITLFQRTLANGFRPDAITFISVLSCCVHKGSVEEGRKYFNMMASYHIRPELHHYTCMVDLLSRSGHLNEAYKLIQCMPMEPDVVVWSALLSGCVIHGNVMIGETAAKKLIELDEKNTANFVLLANLYAGARRPNDLARTRQMIKEKGMNKNQGCSWIEDKGQIHVFLANDVSHEQADEIYDAVEKLNWHMRMQESSRKIDLNILLEVAD